MPATSTPPPPPFPCPHVLIIPVYYSENTDEEKAVNAECVTGIIIYLYSSENKLYERN